ncbi:TPA: hypothetical protein ACS72F_000383 [Providencia alcalifaciens]
MINEKHSPQFKTLMSQINSHKRSMFKWWLSIQKSTTGEWTLLLTLACWGVPNHHFRLIGFTIGLFFFAARIYALSIKNKYTTKTETYLEHKIRNARISDSEREHLINNLKLTQKSRKTRLVLKLCWKLFLAYVFFAASFLFIIFMYWGNYIKPFINQIQSIL